jgi:nitroreductase
MNLLEALQWRYATKKMNGKAVSQQDVDKIVEAARLAPSSVGLQPYKIIVISNPELKKQLLPVANNQQQVVDASHVLVFAAWDKYTQERINTMVDHINNERGLPLSNGDAFKKGVSAMLLAMTEEQQTTHAAKQVYISFGIALAEAAELGVDATPMEGFNKQALDELLGLPSLGLKSVVIMPLGYRDETNDWLSKLKKVRTPKSDFIINR